MASRSTSGFLLLCTALLFNNALLCQSVHIKIAAILPSDDFRMFSIRRIAPAIETALASVANTSNFLDGHTFSVKYEDSHCSISEGMHKAINFYVQKEVTAFFGPVCDYAVAPVARETRYWKIPLISGGAMARDFTNKKQTMYSMLTRVGPVNLVSLAEFFETTLRHYNWASFTTIYDRPGQDNIMTGFCNLAAAAIHHGMLSVAKDIKQTFFRTDQAKSIEQILREKVGLEYSGR